MPQVFPQKPVSVSCAKNTYYDPRNGTEAEAQVCGDTPSVNLKEPLSDHEEPTAIQKRFLMLPGAMTAAHQCLSVSDWTRLGDGEPFLQRTWSLSHSAVRCIFHCLCDFMCAGGSCRLST